MERQKYGIQALAYLFIPGLGQLIKGDILRGILIWLIVGVLTFFCWWTVIVPAIIYIWNVYDVYNSN